MSLPLLHAGRTNPGLSAALDLRFALDKSLTAYRGPTPSFSRASTGSYFDGSGVLRYATVNLVQYSEQFDNGWWAKAGPTITQNATVAPDGKTTADRMVEDTGSTDKPVYRLSIPVTAGATHTWSVYAKADQRSWIYINAGGGLGNRVWFDISAGAIGTIEAGVASAVITPVGNGWYRCSVTRAPAGATANFEIYMTTGNAVTAYTGNGTSGLFIWGAQLEASSTVGTYCPTTSSANSAPRFNHTYNGTSWVSRGLLVEEQRTNLAIWSEDFTNAAWIKPNVNVSGNAVIAPDGNLTADLVYPVPGSTWAYAGIERNNGGGVAGNPMTISFFFKAAGKSWVSLHHGDGADAAWFNISTGTIGTIVSGNPSISNVGNGWYKCSITRNIASNGSGWTVFRVCDSDGSTSVTGSGTNGVYAWGAQTENGSFPTSYISTTNSSVVRSADVCQITGGDFSGFWNGTEGTVVGDFDRLFVPTGTASVLYTARDSSNNNAIYYYIDVSNDVSEVYASGGSATFNFGAPVGAGISNKIATAYKANDFAASRNGSTPLTDTSGAVPSGQTLLEIGSALSAKYLNGHIARLRYYRKRLPNATLQLLSDPDPTLNLQFALNKTLTPVAGPAPSFSRASTGTYFNASGVLTSASINTPRFDHVYSGGQWVSRGLLVEEQRTNLLMYSEDISYGGWTKTDASVSVNSGIAPDGNITADKLVENTASGVAHRMYYPLSMGTSSSFSAFFKAAGRNYVMMMIYAGANAKLAYFDILNGSVVSTNTPEITAKVQTVGNGWFRCSVTYSGASSSQFVQIHMSPDGITDTYTGDGTSGMFIWGLQAENNVSFPTSYIGTTTSSVTRSADVCQITGTSFNWMWNQGEGSVFTEFDTNAPSVPLATSGFNTQIFAARNPSNFQRIYLGTENYGGRRFYIDDGAASSSVISPGALIGNGVINKASVAWKTNDMAASFDGASVLTDNSQIIPIGITQIDFGTSPANTNYLCGHIAKLIYYPARLTNTKLQQLST